MSELGSEDLTILDGLYLLRYSACFQPGQLEIHRCDASEEMGLKKGKGTALSTIRIIRFHNSFEWE